MDPSKHQHSRLGAEGGGHSDLIAIPMSTAIAQQTPILFVTAKPCNRATVFLSWAGDLGVDLDTSM